MSSDTGLVFLGIGRDVPEPDRGEAGAGEVEGGDVHCERGGTPNHLIMRILNA